MVVFVTAYNDYALQAFEVHALDYLLKPFGRDRLQQSLAHARKQHEGHRAGELGKGIMALVDNIAPERKPDRLVVKSGGRVFFVRTDEIEWIEAAGNYVRLHLATQTHVFRETMNDMEARLDSERFFRIHRSRIVNADRIKELQPWTSGEYLLVLQNGAHLRLSRKLSREAATAAVSKALNRRPSMPCARAPACVHVPEWASHRTSSYPCPADSGAANLLPNRAPARAWYKYAHRAAHPCAYLMSSCRARPDSRPADD